MLNNRSIPSVTLCAGMLVFAATSAAATAPVFSRDIAPVLYKNCASCHRAGEIAPMPLLTYEEVRPWAKSIREKVSLDQMPPWHSADPRGTFSNDRRLTDQDRDTIIRWASAGAPQGDPKDLPPMPQFAEGWEIGTPDLVLNISKPHEVPATGTIAYQYFSVPTNFTEDKWVQAIEVRPGTRSVVHHILVFSREPGATRMPPVFTSVVPDPKDIAARRPGAAGNRGAAEGIPGTLIATTAPGTNAMTYRPGEAIRIRAGATLVFQIHYTANGKETTDQSGVGLIFAKQPPQVEIRNSAFTNGLLDLPPGAPDTKVDSAIEFNQDIHITAIFPHTHLRGKRWDYRMVYPDGRSQVVLTVPKYDFNWQTYYVFANPLAAPKGSRLEASAHYDNSPANPSNPDPKAEVKWGDQTWQEMQYTGITYSVDQQPAPATTSRVEQK